jgi:NAD(P)-dependent dehydrogenase (short-subunit alcohol dehydrogenase family)
MYSQLLVTPEYPTKSFTDQTVIVTGSNVGIGFEAARHFTRLNAAKVILAVRNISAGETAKQSIEESTGRAGVCEVWELDLASFGSVKAFAARASQLPRLDIVVENAGIATYNFRVAEGHESSITVNVISTFLLGLLLLPRLKATAKEFPSSTPHLSIVTSDVHAWTSLPEWKSSNTFATLDEEEAADMPARYPTSKLLEILVVRELSPNLADSGVILNMLTPGLCHSSLSREAGWGIWLMIQLMARSTEVGSRTLVAAAAAGPESHGAYMRDGKANNAALSSFVQSEDGAKAQKKVWEELSEILENIQPGVTNSF